MRELYNEFFYIPKHGKIREKVMLTRIAMTIAIVIMCLAAMSITAYAYFSYNVTSGSNIVKAASFVTDVTVQITDADGVAVENSNITPITSDNKNFVVRGLEVGEWYTVTVEPSSRNTAQTGFIIVSAKGCETTYHTQQLGVDENVEGGKTPQIIFYLMITDTTDVILESHWGTSSYYPAYHIENVDDERYITLKEEIKMIVNGHTEPNVSKGTGDGSDDSVEGDGTNATEGTSVTPSTNTTTGTDSSSTQTSESTTTPAGTTGESTETTKPSTSTTEPTTTQPAETTPTETTDTETTEPAATEPAVTESTATTETQPATENAETTGAPTTEASE